MSQLKVSSLAKVDGSQEVPITDVINGSAKAWVNFNGTGTVAIRGSYNVSSITDNGTGNYTVSFTSALPDTNYAVCSASGDTAGNTPGAGTSVGVFNTSTLQFWTNAMSTSPTAVDRAHASVTIFR
jgi:hypothetical protein